MAATSYRSQESTAVDQSAIAFLCLAIVVKLMSTQTLPQTIRNNLFYLWTELVDDYTEQKVECRLNAFELEFKAGRLLHKMECV